MTTSMAGVAEPGNATLTGTLTAAAATARKTGSAGGAAAICGATASG
jgi:hypothetical protein